MRTLVHNYFNLCIQALGRFSTGCAVDTSLPTRQTRPHLYRYMGEKSPTVGRDRITLGMHFRTGLAPKPNLGGIFCPPHLSARQPGLKSPSQVQGARSHASGKPRDAVSPRRGGDPRPPAMLQAFARLLATPRATLRPPCVRCPPAYSIARPPVRRRTAPSFRWMQEPVSRFAQFKKSRLVQTAFVQRCPLNLLSPVSLKPL